MKAIGRGSVSAFRCNVTFKIAYAFFYCNCLCRIANHPPPHPPFRLYGHTYTLAKKIKEGVDAVEGSEGILYQVRAGDGGLERA